MVTPRRRNPWDIPPPSAIDISQTLPKIPLLNLGANPYKPVQFTPAPQITPPNPVSIPPPPSAPRVSAIGPPANIGGLSNTAASYLLYPLLSAQGTKIAESLGLKPTPEQMKTLSEQAAVDTLAKEEALGLKATPKSSADQSVATSYDKATTPGKYYAPDATGVAQYIQDNWPKQGAQSDVQDALKAAQGQIGKDFWTTVQTTVQQKIADRAPSLANVQKKAAQIPGLTSSDANVAYGLAAPNQDDPQKFWQTVSDHWNAVLGQQATQDWREALNQNRQRESLANLGPMDVTPQATQKVPVAGGGTMTLPTMFPPDEQKQIDEAAKALPSSQKPLDRNALNNLMNGNQGAQSQAKATVDRVLGPETTNQGQSSSTDSSFLGKVGDAFSKVVDEVKPAINSILPAILGGMNTVATVDIGKGVADSAKQAMGRILPQLATATPEEVAQIAEDVADPSQALAFGLGLAAQAVPSAQKALQDINSVVWEPIQTQSRRAFARELIKGFGFRDFRTLTPLEREMAFPRVQNVFWQTPDQAAYLDSVWSEFQRRNPIIAGVFDTAMAMGVAGAVSKTGMGRIATATIADAGPRETGTPPTAPPSGTTPAPNAAEAAAKNAENTTTAPSAAAESGGLRMPDGKPMEPLEQDMLNAILADRQRFIADKQAGRLGQVQIASKRQNLINQLMRFAGTRGLTPDVAAKMVDEGSAGPFAQAAPIHVDMPPEAAAPTTPNEVVRPETAPPETAPPEVSPDLGIFGEEASPAASVQTEAPLTQETIRGRLASLAADPNNLTPDDTRWLMQLNSTLPEDVQAKPNADGFVDPHNVLGAASRFFEEPTFAPKQEQAQPPAPVVEDVTQRLARLAANPKDMTPDDARWVIEQNNLLPEKQRAKPNVNGTIDPRVALNKIVQANKRAKIAPVPTTPVVPPAESSVPPVESASSTVSPSALTVPPGQLTEAPVQGPRSPMVGPRPSEITAPPESATPTAAPPESTMAPETAPPVTPLPNGPAEMMFRQTGGNEVWRSMTIVQSRVVNGRLYYDVRIPGEMDVRRGVPAEQVRPRQEPPPTSPVTPSPTTPPPSNQPLNPVETAQRMLRKTKPRGKVLPFAERIRRDQDQFVGKRYRGYGDSLDDVIAIVPSPTGGYIDHFVRDVETGQIRNHGTQFQLKNIVGDTPREVFDDPDVQRVRSNLGLTPIPERLIAPGSLTEETPSAIPPPSLHPPDEAANRPSVPEITQPGTVADRSSSVENQVVQQKQVNAQTALDALPEAAQQGIHAQLNQIANLKDQSRQIANRQRQLIEGAEKSRGNYPQEVNELGDQLDTLERDLTRRKNDVIDTVHFRGMPLSDARELVRDPKPDVTNDPLANKEWYPIEPGTLRRHLAPDELAALRYKDDPKYLAEYPHNHEIGAASDQALVDAQPLIQKKLDALEKEKAKLEKNQDKKPFTKKDRRGRDLDTTEGTNYKTVNSSIADFTQGLQNIRDEIQARKSPDYVVPPSLLPRQVILRGVKAQEYYDYLRQMHRVELKPSIQRTAEDDAFLQQTPPWVPQDIVERLTQALNDVQKIRKDALANDDMRLEAKTIETSAVNGLARLGYRLKSHFSSQREWRNDITSPEAIDAVRAELDHLSGPLEKLKVDLSTQKQSVVELQSGIGATADMYRWVKQHPWKTVALTTGAFAMKGLDLRQEQEKKTGKPLVLPSSTNPLYNVAIKAQAIAGVEVSDVNRGMGWYQDHVADPFAEVAAEVVELPLSGFAQLLHIAPDEKHRGFFDLNSPAALQGENLSASTDLVATLHDRFQARRKISPPLAFVWGLVFDPLNWIGWGEADATRQAIEWGLSNEPRVVGKGILDISEGTQPEYVANELRREVDQELGTRAANPQEYLQKIDTLVHQGKASLTQMRVAKLLGEQQPIDLESVAKLADHFGQPNATVDEALVQQVQNLVLNKTKLTTDDLHTLGNLFNALPGQILKAEKNANVWVAERALPDLSREIEHMRGLSADQFTQRVFYKAKAAIPVEKHPMMAIFDKNPWARQALLAGQQLQQRFAKSAPGALILAERIPATLVFLAGIGWPVHVAAETFLRRLTNPLQILTDIKNVSESSVIAGRNIGNAGRILALGQGPMTTRLRTIGEEAWKYPWWEDFQAALQAYLPVYGEEVLAGHNGLANVPAKATAMDVSSIPFVGRGFSNAIAEGTRTMVGHLPLSSPVRQAVDKFAAPAIDNANLARSFAIEQFSIAKMGSMARVHFVTQNHPIVFNKVLDYLGPQYRQSYERLVGLLQKPEGVPDGLWNQIKPAVQMALSHGQAEKIVQDLTRGRIARQKLAKRVYEEQGIPISAQAELWATLAYATPEEQRAVFAPGGRAEDIIKHSLIYENGGTTDELIANVMDRMIPDVLNADGKIKDGEKSIKQAKSYLIQNGAGMSQTVRDQWATHIETMESNVNNLKTAQAQQIRRHWNDLNDKVNALYEIHATLWDWAYDTAQGYSQEDRNKFFSVVRPFRQKLIETQVKEAKNARNKFWNYLQEARGIPVPPKDAFERMDNLVKAIKDTFTETDQRWAEYWSNVAKTGKHDRVRLNEIRDQNTQTWNAYKRMRSDEMEKINDRLQSYFARKRKPGELREVLPVERPQIPPEQLTEANNALNRIRLALNQFIDKPSIDPQVVDKLTNWAKGVDQSVQNMGDAAEKIQQAHQAAARIVARKMNTHFVNYTNRTNLDTFMTTFWPFWMYDFHGGRYYGWLTTHVPGATETYDRYQRETTEAGTPQYFPLAGNITTSSGQPPEGGLEMSLMRGFWPQRLITFANALQSGRPPTLAEMMGDQGVLSAHMNPMVEYATEALTHQPVSMPPVGQTINDLWAIAHHGGFLVEDPYKDYYTRTELFERGIEPDKATPEQRSAAEEAVAARDIPNSLIPRFAYKSMPLLEARKNFQNLLEQQYGISKQAQAQMKADGIHVLDTLDIQQKRDIFKQHPEWAYQYELNEAFATPEQRQQRTDVRTFVEKSRQITSDRLAQQQTDDTALSDHQMTPRQWMTNHSQRESVTKGRRTQLSLEQYAVDAQKILNDPKRANLLLPQDRAVTDYYAHYGDWVKQNTDPVTRQVNWQNVQQAEDQYIAGLSPSIQQYVQSELNRNQTPVEKQFHDALKLLDQYNAIPRWIGIPADQAKERVQEEANYQRMVDLNNPGAANAYKMTHPLLRRNFPRNPARDAFLKDPKNALLVQWFEQSSASRLKITPADLSYDNFGEPVQTPWQTNGALTQPVPQMPQTAAPNGTASNGTAQPVPQFMPAAMRNRSQ